MIRPIGSQDADFDAENLDSNFDAEYLGSNFDADRFETKFLLVYQRRIFYSMPRGALSNNYSKVLVNGVKGWWGVQGEVALL